MSPSFLEIWLSKNWGICEYHPQLQWNHSRRYYRVRSLVRMAFWFPILGYAYSMILGAM